MGNSVMGGFGAQCCPAGCGSSSSGAHKSSTMDSLAAMALPVPALASTSRGKTSVVTQQQHHPSSSPQRANPQHQTNNSRSPAKPDFSSSDQMSFSRVKPSNDRRTDPPMAAADEDNGTNHQKAVMTRSGSRASSVKHQDTPDGQNSAKKAESNPNMAARQQQQDALMEQAKVLESRRNSIERHQSKLQAEAEELFPTIGKCSNNPKQSTERDNSLENELKPISSNQDTSSPRQPMNHHLMQQQNPSPIRPSAVVETDEEVQDSLRLERELIELRQKVLAALKHATSLQHAQEVQEEEKGGRMMSDFRVTGGHTSGFRQQQAVEAELVRVQELTKDVQRRRVDLSYRVNRSLRERSASSSHLDQMLMSSMVMFPQHHHSGRRGQGEFNQPSHGDYSSTWARGRMNQYDDWEEPIQPYSHPAPPFGIPQDSRNRSCGRDQHHLAQQRLWHCQQNQQHHIPMTRSRTVGAGHARRASDATTSGPYSFLDTSNQSRYYGGQPIMPDRGTFTMPNRGPSGLSNASWIQQQQDPWWTAPPAALINSRPMSMSHQHLGGLDDDHSNFYGHFHQQSRQPPGHHQYSNQQPSPRGHAEALATLPYSTTSRVPLVPGHPPGMGIPAFHHMSISTAPHNLLHVSSTTPRNQSSPHSVNWEEESDWLAMRSPGRAANHHQFHPNHQPTAGAKRQAQPVPPSGASSRYNAPAPPGVASYSLLREMSSRSTTSPDPSIRRLHNSNSPAATTQSCVTSPTPTVTDKIAARIGRTSLLMPQVATLQNKKESAGSTTAVGSPRSCSRPSQHESGENGSEVRPSGDGREDVAISSNAGLCDSSVGMKSPSSNDTIQDGKGRGLLSQEEQEVLAELEHPETVIEMDPVLSQFKRSMSLPRNYSSAAGRMNMMSSNKLKNNNQHQMATTENKQQTNMGHHQHPDIVRSTIAMAINSQSRSKGTSKELKFNEDTIDSILGTPKKISIPERYVPEGVELTEEERATRSKKAEAIRKMLVLSSGTNTGGSNFVSSQDVALSTTKADNKTAEDTGRSIGDGASSDASGPEIRATFAPTTTATDEKGPLSSFPPSTSSQAEKQHMEHMLALNQALAKEVVEKTSKAAERATPAGHHRRSMSISDDFLMCQTSSSISRKSKSPISDNDEEEESPVHPLPLVQQRDNYLT